MQSRLAFTSVAVFFFLASPALAAGSKEVKEKEKAARKACMMGDYMKGSDILSDLFIETGDSTYIFNQARCLQQNHRWQEAADRFQEFLRKAKNLSDAEATETNKYLAECEDHLPKISPAAEPASPRPAPSQPAPPQPSQPQPASVPNEVTSSAPKTPSGPVTTPAAEKDRRSGLRKAGIISGALGLAEIGAGVYCSVKTYSLRDDPDRLSTYKTWGIVSYVAGGATLATGTALFILGVMERRSADSGVTVSVSVTPGMSALIMQGRF